MPGDPWYREGLRFRCTRCGNCCTGAGVVRVSDAEIEALARRLALSDAELRAAYTRELRGGVVALREKRNRDCIFYDARRGCTVYEERPRQCRSWPFWRAVVHSRERWAEEAEGCPGMNQGAHFDADAIREILRDDGTSGVLPD
jgi:Fe-S-cluster containining protein